MTFANNFLIYLFGWSLFLIGLSYILSGIWRSIFPGKSYQFFIFPGILIHELSHALACLITGAKIKEFKVSSSKGSYVRHTKPRIPLAGTVIIGLAPVIGGLGVLFIFSRILALPLPELSDLLIWDLIKSVVGFIGDHWESWKFWIYCYIAASVMISLIPSKKDLKNAFWGIVFLAALFFFLLRIDVISQSFLSYLIGILVLGSFFACLALAIGLPIFIIKKAI